MRRRKKITREQDQFLLHIALMEGLDETRCPTNDLVLFICLCLAVAVIRIDFDCLLLDVVDVIEVDHLKMRSLPDIIC